MDKKIEIKKAAIAIYLALIVLIVIAPALFLPQFFFGESTGSIAIIGGSENSTSIFLSGKPTKWGNLLFPAFLLLTVINGMYLISYFIKKFRPIKR